MSDSFPSSFRFLLSSLALLIFSGCAQFSDTASHLNPFRQPTGPAKIVIDLSQQKAVLYRGGEIATITRISSGREGYDTPTGRFSVIEKDLDHHSSAYGAYVLAGTRKIVVPDVDTRTSRPPAGTTYIGAPMPFFLRFQERMGCTLAMSRIIPPLTVAFACQNRLRNAFSRRRN